ncbi:Uncharacterized protein XB16_2702 [Leptospira santarosai]|uniref:Uncharacterized protein n=1 Tax=Leptospira santarosai TaxID=28183 RepID=A0A2P1QVT6_9LEPT|nr:Uncharacterized protein XB16_2702 [Leptospira santarosai]
MGKRHVVGLKAYSTAVQPHACGEKG